MPLSRFLFPHLLLYCSLSAASWPQWRGPDANGSSPETNVVTHWSSTENVRWKVPLPDRGNSTPIIWGDKIFLTQAIQADNRRLVVCYDRKSGKKLWENGITTATNEPTHADNPYCSGSPATDGERVIAFFGEPGISAYDLQGKELWHRDLGKQAHIWGNAASPVLHGNLCYLNFGPGERTFIIALDKKTGKTVWQHDVPGGKFGEKSNDWLGSWSTPLFVPNGTGEALVVGMPSQLLALDPKTGQTIWTCAGLNLLVYTSPLYDRGIIVAMGGFNGSTIAVKNGGQGDITASNRLWQIPRTRQRIGSGILHQGLLYIVDEPCILQCIQPDTGKLLWEERLPGKGPRNDTWSSLVRAGDKFLIPNQSGDVFVIRASPTYELISVNSVGERTLASLAIANGDIYLRTFNNLWCIGKP